MSGKNLASADGNSASSLVEVGDLVGLSKPLCKLVEVAASGFGVLFEPVRIRRKARAKADAAIVRAEADAASRAIESRAAARIIAEEVRRQQNLESILAIAAESLPEEVSEEPVDPDWVAHFTNEARDTSSEEMRLLWGKLLAGEVAQPGTFGRRTITAVKQFDVVDAQLFAKVIQFLVLGKSSVVVIDRHNDLVRDEFELTFSRLHHLEAIGLIRFNSGGTFGLHLPLSDDAKPMLIDLKYCEHSLRLDACRGNRVDRDGKKLVNVDLGHVMLTSMGQQVASLVEQEYDEKVHRYLVSHFVMYNPATPL